MDVEEVETMEQIGQGPVRADKMLLAIEDLRVWFTLRRRGFGEAGQIGRAHV